MHERRHGALHVVEQARPRDPIQAALRQIDPRLFVERQITLDGEQVWVVNVDLGRDDATGIVTLLEWRDEHGRPLPELSEGIVGQVARMERDGAVLHRKVIEANRNRTERGRRDLVAQTEEATKDVVAAMGWRKATSPRGRSLYIARSRQRESGIDV